MRHWLSYNLITGYSFSIFPWLHFYERLFDCYFFNIYLILHFQLLIEKKIEFFLIQLHEPNRLSPNRFAHYLPISALANTLYEYKVLKHKLYIKLQRKMLHIQYITGIFHPTYNLACESHVSRSFLRSRQLLGPQDFIFIATKSFFHKT